MHPDEAQKAIETFATGPTEAVLAVDGPFIDTALRYFPTEFVTAASQAPATVIYFKFYYSQMKFYDPICCANSVDLLPMFADAKSGDYSVNSARDGKTYCGCW